MSVNFLEGSSIPVPLTRVFGAIEEPLEVHDFVLKPLPQAFSFLVKDHTHLQAFTAALSAHPTLQVCGSRHVFRIFSGGPIAAEVRLKAPATIDDVLALIDRVDLRDDGTGRETMRSSLSATEIEDNPHARKAHRN